MTKPNTTSAGASLASVIGGRVMTLRKHRDWTQQQLARRCSDYGLPTTQPEIARVEGADRGRRITVDLWFTLALALDVPPLALLKTEGRLRVGETDVPADRVIDWIIGRMPLNIVSDHNHYREHAVIKTVTDRAPGLGSTLRYIAGALDSEDLAGQVEAIDAAIDYLHGARQAALMTRTKDKK